eukprot:1161843-Pelagomonas_calceolata.AAC.1
MSPQRQHVRRWALAGHLGAAPPNPSEFHNFEYADVFIIPHLPKRQSLKQIREGQFWCPEFAQVPGCWDVGEHT